MQNFHSILASPDIYFYRNKMEFSFGNEKDLAILGRDPHPESRVHLGLHPKGRFALVTPTPECQLLSERSQLICRAVEEWASDHQVSVYVRKNGKGDLRHLVIREGKNTGDCLVNLVSKSTTPHVDALAERLRALPISTFIWTAYDGLSDVAGGEGGKVYWGNGVIHEKIGGTLFRVNANSFMQTNTRAAEILVQLLRLWVSSSRHAFGRDPGVSEENLGPVPLNRDGQKIAGATLLDLYCGAGTIGLSLANLFERVIGIEINRQAIHDANENLRANNVGDVKFLEGKAEDAAAFLSADEIRSATIVVDPPRPGLHPKLVDTLLLWKAQRLFYVSCNPESLARDLQRLSAAYEVAHVQPLDFFPHTDHVETAVQLRLKA